MFRTEACLSLLAVVATFGLAGCGSDPEPPPAPPPQPPPEPTATVAEPAPTATATTGITTGPCDATMHLALQTAIQARAKKDLSFHMKPEGAFTCQTVNEGESATVPVTLQPGRCYSFLAHSFPNVTEIDVFLKPNFGNPAPPLLAAFANMVFAQDSETGPVASIGPGKNCFKNPMPIPGAAMVEVTARIGSGPVAVQVYSK